MIRIIASLRLSTVFAFAAATALVTVAVPLPVDPGSLVEARTSSGTGHRFHWEAPKNATGTFAASVTVDPGGEAQCEWQVQATGRTNASNPVAYWEQVTSLGATSSTFLGHWHHPARVHAGPADTALLTGSDDGRWRKVMEPSEFRVPDELTLMVAAFDLEHREKSGLEAPLEIDVSCDAPIDVTLEAGRHAHSFTHDSLEGGVGVASNVLVQRHIARDDGLADTFSIPRVVFNVMMLRNPDAHDTEGTMTLDYPGGSETWTWDPGGPNKIDVDGGPGRYEVSLDWYDETHDELFGAIIGLDPVGSLDEVLG